MQRVALDPESREPREHAGDRAPHCGELGILKREVLVRDLELVLDILARLEPLEERAKLETTSREGIVGRRGLEHERLSTPVTLMRECFAGCRDDARPVIENGNGRGRGMQAGKGDVDDRRALARIRITQEDSFGSVAVRQNSCQREAICTAPDVGILCKARHNRICIWR